VQAGPSRAYHIGRNAKLGCWVLSTMMTGFMVTLHDLVHATDLATQQSHNDHNAGLDVIARVQQEYGAFATECSSRWG
jgi:hypothetical protein